MGFAASIDAASRLFLPPGFYPCCYSVQLSALMCFCNGYFKWVDCCPASGGQEYNQRFPWSPASISLIIMEPEESVAQHERMARLEGLEPPAYRFEVCRSIQLSYRRVFQNQAVGAIGQGTDLQFASTRVH